MGGMGSRISEVKADVNLADPKSSEAQCMAERVPEAENLQDTMANASRKRTSFRWWRLGVLL